MYFREGTHRSSHLVAWAIPVSPVDAIARLQAYVQSKAIISTLRSCVQRFKIGGHPMGEFPEELILIIEDHLREDMFSGDTWEVMSLHTKWQGHLRCMNDECTPIDHFCMKRVRNWVFGSEQVGSILDHIGSDSSGSQSSGSDSLGSNSLEPGSSSSDDLPDGHIDPGSYECFDWEGQDHEETHSKDDSPFSRTDLFDFLGLQLKDRSLGEFERYNKVLEQDFGVRLYFDYSEYAYHEGMTHYRMFSYLIFSGAQETMGSNIYQCHYLTHAAHQHTSFLDPKQLPPMSKRLQKKFDRAMKSFKLKPHIEYCNLPYQIAVQHKVKDDERIGEDEQRREIRKAIKKLEKSKWPKMTVLAYSHFQQTE